jgi:uncharacterized protein
LLAKELLVIDQSILWRRLDQPGHEAGRLYQSDSGWHLTGTAVFAHNQQACRLDYLVTCDAAWQTRSGRVAGWVGTKPVAIDLAVDSAGRWWLNGAECPAVAGCIDLDLNFSPSTNLLPIRRLNLAVGAAAEVRAAWLRFPSFALEPLNQIYRRISSTTYRYESAGGQFVADLQVNGIGVVTEYPLLWQIEAGS